MPSSQCSAWRARPNRVLERSREGTKRGAVLVQVLVLSVLGLVISSALMSGLLEQAYSLRRDREAAQVFYAAESGIQHTIQYLVNAVSQEDDAIEQFREVAAVWNRPAPFVGAVGEVRYEARVVDVSPNLAFQAFVRKYADVTIEAEARPRGARGQMVRATYRLHLGPTGNGGQRATRVLWLRS